MRRIATLFLAALLGSTGCDDRSYREIGAAIDVLTKKREGVPGPAIDRLKSIGRRSIPQVETAMHTAAPGSRIQLISALDAIGDPESAHILRHFGTYDTNPAVRAACEEVLQRWAAASDQRSTAAKAALLAIADKRAKGETE
jgi:hypothetical protein